MRCWPPDILHLILFTAEVQNRYFVIILHKVLLMCLKTFSCCPCLITITLTTISFHSGICCVVTRYILYLNVLGYTVISYEIIQWVEFAGSHSICVSTYLNCVISFWSNEKYNYL